uniref:Uncharacterized protein n=1 Tax=Tolypothrix bouteillei VB521301 TaxID=1479485 RepID=A0A0C1N8Y6_9CYAN
MALGVLGTLLSKLESKSEELVEKQFITQENKLWQLPEQHHSLLMCVSKFTLKIEKMKSVFLLFLACRLVLTK